MKHKRDRPAKHGYIALQPEREIHGDMIVNIQWKTRPKKTRYVAHFRSPFSSQ